MYLSIHNVSRTRIRSFDMKQKKNMKEENKITKAENNNKK